MDIILLFLLFQDTGLPAAAVLTPAAVGGVALLIIGYFTKQKLNTYDQHLLECNEKHAVIAVLDEQVKTIGKSVDEISKDVKVLLTHMPPATLPTPRNTRGKK